MDVIRNRARLILALGLLALMVTLYVVEGQAPAYRASVVLRLADERSTVTRTIDDWTAPVPAARNNAVRSEGRLLQSRNLIGAVVDELGLQLVPEEPLPWSALEQPIRVGRDAQDDTIRLDFSRSGFTVHHDGTATPGRYGEAMNVGQVRFSLGGDPGLDQGTLRVIVREEAIDRVLADLRIAVEEGTDIFTVDFTAPDPHLAQLFVNELATRHLASSVRDAQQEARRRRIFLEEQMTQTDSLLSDAQSALTQYRRREGIFGSQNMIQAQQVGLMQLELRREELAAQARTLRSLSENLRTAGDDSEGFDAVISTPGMSDNLAIQGLYDQLIVYQTQLDSMVAGEWGNATSHPDVERLRTLVASVQDRLRTAVENHVAALEARVAALDELRARHSAVLSALPEAQAEESRLAQRVEGIRQLAEQLRSEYQKARVEEAVEAGRIAIVDRASLPYRPVPQWKPLKVALGIMGGLLAGTALAFLLELKGDQTIRRRSEVEALRVPALTVIPRLPAADGARFLSRRLSRPSSSTALSKRFVISSQPDSAGAEAYRMLGTTLRLGAAGEVVRTIAVTSASPGDGKTTTALNLATALASEYCRVRLIDGDRRNPRVHELFDAAVSPGLADVLVGRARINEVIRSTSVTGLSIVTAGTLGPDHGELSGLPRLREAVRALGAGVNFVVIDSPPVLALADAVLLAAVADGVLFVARVGTTERQLVRLALERLRTVDARVLGAVLNDPDDELASDERVEARYYGLYTRT